MRCLLIYDIPDDGARTKVADVCLDYGLDRIQYSAFLGQLNRGRQEELLLRIQKRMGKKAGNVQLIPICATDWQARLTHIKEAEATKADGPKAAESDKAKVGKAKSVPKQTKVRGK
jgi:CRISPR-associated protein Cas2